MSAVGEDPAVAAARAEAAAARARLMTTLHEIQARLAPRSLAQDAWDNVRDRGVGLADDAIEVVRTRPVAVAAVSGAIAAFLARKTLWSLFSGGKETQPPSGVEPDDEAQTAAETVG